ncbi:MAG: sugar transferase [Anaerolineaceae bacterium]|jgi:exopolysaccharide biosynthesis polyprenyl glycosylphosphotransferase
MSSSLQKLDVFETPIEGKVISIKEKVSLQKQWKLFLLALILVDFMTLWAGLWLAYIVRFRLGVPVFELWVRPSVDHYQKLMVIMVVLFLGVFYIQGLYNKDNLLGGTKEYSTLFNAITISVVLVIAAGFLEPTFILARGWLLVAWFASFFMTSLGRFIFRRFVYMLRRHGFFLSPAIIVGANDEGVMLAQQLLQWKTSGFHVLGFVDKKIRPGEKVYGHLKCLGNMDQLDEVIEKYKVGDLILASSAISSRDKMVDIFKKYGFSTKINIRFSSGLYEIITTGVTVNQFAYVPLMGVNPVRLSGVEQVGKYLMDYVITSLILILGSPLFLLIALAIKLDSPGPVIHRRRVVGLNGRQFDAYKFRSMHVNGDEIIDQYPELKKELQVNHKLKYDPRITRIGRILRKFSLDELPQLLNVIKGEMSLVGPRMITPEEMEKYNQWDTNLVTVRPGITGLWQVSGRSDITYEERVRLDMYYIRNWNMWLDIQLIIQTIPAVLRARGAY